MKQAINNQSDNTGKTFRRLSLLTVFSIYFLILVGGIVRSTGAGMGCPDWPKCFGQWVPPTNESELPEGYEREFTEQRLEKNRRFSQYLSSLGFEKKAEQILSDPGITEDIPFNAAKTWTEYVNRLVGALIGLFVFATFVASFSYLRKDPVIFWLSFLSLILVGFQGWIGSIVVSSNLLTWMITVHMILALAIVALLIYVSFRSNMDNIEVRPPGSKFKTVYFLIILCMITMISQIVLGTEVREGIDEVARRLGYSARNQWIDALGTSFYIHRTYSLIITAIHVWLLVLLMKDPGVGTILAKSVKLLLLLIVIEVVLGAIMAYFAIPAFAQPVHLLLASLIFGVQFVIWLVLERQRKLTAVIA
ncbi:heme A synthase [Roseivirga sp. BDSF3-8]|uniref:COX15/CtaA family protein n=1 Tax=Roseivirga sp. BDSF3-8 TaxID=3241598 RepID=UPI0035319BDE